MNLGITPNSVVKLFMATLLIMAMIWGTKKILGRVPSAGVQKFVSEV